jgi:quercetin dioxygenase-like cupin family protein
VESKGQVKVVPPDGGTWLPWLGAPLQYQVLGEDSDHTYAFSRTHIPVGGGPPPHRHTFEEGLYVLRGALTFTAGDQTFAVPAGGFIHVGGGTAHFFHNTGDTEAELLLVAAPAGVDAFHRETSGGDLDRIRAAASKYGIDLDLPADAFRRPPRVTLRLPGAGRSLAVVGDVYTFLAVGDETDGKYALWDAVVHPGGGPPPHRHRREEEGFYVLEGSVTFFAVGDMVCACCW